MTEQDNSSSRDPVGHPVSTLKSAVEYRSVVDKGDWRDGPWKDEIDKRQWTDEATGLPCLIVRGPSGALCGYVGVSSSHAFHGKGYDDVEADVHGGLTYAAGCQHGDDPSRGICHIPAPGEPDDVWWFGFDCAHARDHSPGCGVIEYRDAAYVTDQCTALAAQLLPLADGPQGQDGRSQEIREDQ